VWGRNWKGLRICMYCDNSASVTVLNSGRCKDQFMLSCLREIAFWAATYEFELRAVHLPGVENRTPDLLSRWHVNPAHYSKLFKQLDPHDRLERIPIDKKLFHFTYKW
jgi:hypothetical protein